MWELRTQVGAHRYAAQHQPQLSELSVILAELAEVCHFSLQTVGLPTLRELSVQLSGLGGLRSPNRLMTLPNFGPPDSSTEGLPDSLRRVERTVGDCP